MLITEKHFSKNIRVDINGVYCEMRNMKMKFGVTKAIMM